MRRDRRRDCPGPLAPNDRIEGWGPASKLGPIGGGRGGQLGGGSKRRSVGQSRERSERRIEGDRVTDERGKRRTERQRGRDGKSIVDRASHGKRQGADGSCSDGEISHAATTEEDRVRQGAQWGEEERRRERQRGAVGHRLQKTADAAVRSEARLSATPCVPQPRRWMGGGLRNRAAGPFGRAPGAWSRAGGGDAGREGTVSRAHC